MVVLMILPLSIRIPLGFLGLESGYGGYIKIFAKSSGDFEIFVKGND